MIEHPPEYERLVWDYKNSNQNAIAKALDEVDWNFLFFNENIHEQVCIFYRTLMNVFFKFYLN